MKFIILIFILLIFQNIVFAKLKPVKGYVLEENRKPLEKAKVFSVPSKTSTSTNSEGFFSIEVPIRDRKIVISKSGYHSDTLNVIFFKNNTFSCLVEEKSRSRVGESVFFSKQVAGTVVGAKF